MKCPKCGYNSFEYYSICKKCSADFSAYKQTYGIVPIVLPPEAREKKANEFRSASSVNEQPVESVETGDDMFSFDMPVNATPTSNASPSKSDDPFNFDASLPEADSERTKTEGGEFADLLESTPRDDYNPFASHSAASSAPPVKTEAQTSGPDEYDLGNFSWDDAPPAETKGGGQLPPMILTLSLAIQPTAPKNSFQNST